MMGDSMGGSMLADGISLGELARQISKSRLSLDTLDVPCLVFNPDKSGLFQLGQNSISQLLKLADTDVITECYGEYIHNGYLHPEAMVVPLLKKDPTSSSGKNIVIGRSDVSDIRIKNKVVSKDHAWIKHTLIPDQWWIIDNCSTNGVKVNGVPLEPARPYGIEDSYELSIGTVQCVFLKKQGLLALCSLLKADSTSLR